MVFRYLDNFQVGEMRKYEVYGEKYAHKLLFR